MDFKTRSPNVELSPDYLIYESYQINYQKYYTESIKTAKWLAHFAKHIYLSKVKKHFTFNTYSFKKITHRRRVKLLKDRVYYRL